MSEHLNECHKNLNSTAILIWFTGLSGSGKSTLARKLDGFFRSRGIHTQMLDGDVFRQGLSKDLGFSRADRSKNIRRAGEVASCYLTAAH